MTDAATARPRVRGGRRAGLAILAGAVAALGHVPFALVPAAVVGIGLAFHLFATAGGPREAAFLGWLTGVGYFAVALHWIVEPFLVFPERHGVMAPFALVLTAAGFGLFWAAGFALARWAAGRGTGVLAFAGALTLVEIARGTILSGFPWALVGYVWTRTPAIQWAAVVGPHGLGLATLLLAAGAAAAVAARRPGRLVTAGLGLVALLVVGLILTPPAATDADRPVVRLVQPAAPQSEKWDPVAGQQYVRRQVEATAALSEPRPDLVVWPEMAVPYALGSAGAVFDAAAAAADGAPVLIGLPRYDGPGIYNSLVLVGRDGAVRDVYDKVHLVPFGEYIPLGRLGAWIGLDSFAPSDGYGYSPGTDRRLLDLGPLGQALPLICYEGIFPEEVGPAARGADFMVLVTNDAWFGTFSGPYQHLAQARVRAIEQRLPMVRVANTGVSAMIDPAGRIRDSLPLGEAGYVDAALPAPGRPGLYAATGDWAAAMLALLALGATVLRRR